MQIAKSLVIADWFRNEWPVSPVLAGTCLIIILMQFAFTDPVVCLCRLCYTRYLSFHSIDKTEGNQILYLLLSKLTDPDNFIAIDGTDTIKPAVFYWLPQQCL